MKGTVSSYEVIIGLLLNHRDYSDVWIPVPNRRPASLCKTFVHESDPVPSMRNMRGKTMREIGSDYGFMFKQQDCMFLYWFYYITWLQMIISYEFRFVSYSFLFNLHVKWLRNSPCVRSLLLWLPLYWLKHIYILSACPPTEGVVQYFTVITGCFMLDSLTLQHQTGWFYVFLTPNHLFCLFLFLGLICVMGYQMPLCAAMHVHLVVHCCLRIKIKSSLLLLHWWNDDSGRRRSEMWCLYIYNQMGFSVWQK